MENNSSFPSITTVYTRASFAIGTQVVLVTKRIPATNAEYDIDFFTTISGAVLS
jgi:hypothetical protein